ncbi:MAG: hypothetical protein F6K48_12950 [Okeania sp. SIO3H1]|uniref:hypothetical protein n=1 Tax=Okeania sp. SIO1I7 TaxID=2607772 RepID=UPI0013C6CE50|nr:hypothetical protein [Okeania sp. SIO1I7]NEN89763.1 hypothetical protein [Okeania sp. SIO3H1]NET27385.1 hypothetical protein [Okeania sp. SIO1I7]
MTNKGFSHFFSLIPNNSIIHYPLLNDCPNSGDRFSVPTDSQTGDTADTTLRDRSTDRDYKET